MLNYINQTYKIFKVSQLYVVKIICCGLYAFSWRIWVSVDVILITVTSMFVYD
jgi:hypothetical protein